MNQKYIVRGPGLWSRDLEVSTWLADFGFRVLGSFGDIVGLQVVLQPCGISLREEYERRRLDFPSRQTDRVPMV